MVLEKAPCPWFDPSVAYNIMLFVAWKAASKAGRASKGSETHDVILYDLLAFLRRGPNLGINTSALPKFEHIAGMQRNKRVRFGHSPPVANF
jgi:hypothetical protein